MTGYAEYGAWGRLPAPPQRAIRDLSGPSLAAQSTSLLPYGRGRSYGDSCLNSDGVLLDTRDQDHLLSFDNGVLRCESGVRFDDLVRLFVPLGWFLPVTPGTTEITLGGAIANDVHGKNHHRAGTFGRHVRRIGLWRSDRGELTCSADQDPELFGATIGGLGLTGLIRWAEFDLKPIPSNAVRVMTEPFDTLEQFMNLSFEHSTRAEYTLAWLDSLSAKRGRCRGLFFAGNHADEPVREGRRWRPSLPSDLPGFVLNRGTIGAFNRLYYQRGKRRGTDNQSLWRFFYPLDGIRHWNRLYGRRGFYQYQCVVPLDAVKALQRLLETIRLAGQGSFLGVLKVFSDIPSPGWLSFPRQGVCLALDLPNRGPDTAALLKRLDLQLAECGGRLYPAKDACMSPTDFAQAYPALERFRGQCDPAFSSDFWRRVSAKGGV
ncbi:FAD-dependent oxidoreductase [Ferrimonas balearica]|uniref:FAD-binding oxidoreductase n=1 Tax=Ferrimonas balearica TaxID=44012 RepID=UPI001C98EC63|nr:FAD-binding oxidoreductase [Ferrimonas balearica]MBY5991865.1 FAD-binding oxidoreductase [Ferrimonas balearica]